MSYGPDFNDIYKRAGTYVAKVLNGAKPSDLPVEQPRKFLLVINLKAAAALGIALPQELLSAADELIRLSKAGYGRFPALVRSLSMSPEGRLQVFPMPIGLP